MSSAVVTNIQGYSIHDGPGIRTVVFLKGCPLKCRWCANPENLISKPQIGFISNLCVKCGRCLKACGTGAITFDSDYRINRTLCTECMDCVKQCYYEALVGYGEIKTADEVFNKVRKDKMFYVSSGGGVTVSGGEPLLYGDFVTELFRMCQADGINTCVETCGNVSSQTILDVLPYTNIFYFDLKIMDSAAHKEYTGVGNELIFENARILAEKGADILFRQPVIPGVNNDEANIRATASFIKTLSEKPYGLQLMPYHRMGESKYKALNIDYEMVSVPIMSSEEINAVKQLYLDLGVECTISR